MDRSQLHANKTETVLASAMVHYGSCWFWSWLMHLQERTCVKLDV